MEDTTLAAGREYTEVQRITGPLVVVETAESVGFGEVAEVRGSDGRTRIGRVLEAGDTYTVVQVFGGTEGLSPGDTRIRFLGKPVELPVSGEMLGRIFDGAGRPIDGGPPPLSQTQRDVNGLAINPVRRAYPREFIQTGISALDGLNTLVRGQKLPIFSGAGLPHNELAAQLIAQSTIRGAEEEFGIVFAAIGVKNDDARFFQEQFEEAGRLQSVTMFLNLASDPPEERILTPRCALTLAEHLAFEMDLHVLVIITDMTNYCEALRELAAAREVVPSRKGYPGYMYTDLASLYERTGRIRDRKGSITQIPILTMPNMDISHPVPDLTGYITEGQVVLSPELHQKGVYPPVNVLDSLSRLMKDGIGEGLTREDHPNVASQLYAAYAESRRARALGAIIGEDELSSVDRQYLEFGDGFEARFIGQGPRENRDVEKTLDLGWEMLGILPTRELRRVSLEQIQKYLKRESGADIADEE